MFCKLGLAVFLILTSLNYQTITNAIAASYEISNCYEVKYENFKWWQILIASLFGYDILGWEEVEITNAFSKDAETGEQKIIGVNVTAGDRDEKRIIMSLKVSSNSVSGFVEIIKNKRLQEESVLKLMQGWNYLHTNTESDFELRISSANLFFDDNGYLYCKFTKIKINDKYLTIIKTYKRNGDNNAVIEITLNAPKSSQNSGIADFSIEKIIAQLNSGEKIIMTLKLR